MTKKFLFLFFLFFVTISNAQNMNDLIINKVNSYKLKYKVNCLQEKITNNRGNDYEGLYGTRNLRTVLYGIAYRGGGNNYYHRTNKRNNKNPLPDDGIRNLLQNGFSTSIYLYETNFEKDTIYISDNNQDTLNYIQIGGNNSKELDKILSLTYKSITDPKFGPLYLHCWNGWHQSGYVSAVLLKQFCGFSDLKSIHYWEDCADNWTRGYDRIKNNIIAFKPVEKYKISKEVSDLICPCYVDDREEDLLSNKEQSLKTLKLSVKFNYNAHELPPGVTTFLDEYARMLKDNPLITIEIGGHTDCIGRKKYNLNLSSKRANNVYTYLLKQNVKQEQLIPKGYGETSLINNTCDCAIKTQECHNENRRIEFKVKSIACHINFSKNSQKITDSSKKVLDDILNILSSDPNAVIEIQGHTCTDGDDFINDYLSIQRADRAYKYLSRRGLNMKNITTKGYGSHNPIASNDNEKGKKKNRRIEFNILDTGNIALRKTIYHTIKKGETLSHLAKNYNTTLILIKKLNPGVSPKTLQIGQKIKIR